MTNSGRPPGKRDRLVSSAAELLHTQGVQRTTIAQIAENANVPVGNVYYYFKSFKELVDAVVAQHQEIIRENLERLDGRGSPKARLKGLAELWSDSADMVASHGCPLGSLCSELNKFHDQESNLSAGLLRAVVDFVERQFRELGRDDAAALAITLVARIQGAALLANTFSDKVLLADEVRSIGTWLDELS